MRDQKLKKCRRPRPTIGDQKSPKLPRDLTVQGFIQGGGNLGFPPTQNSLGKFNKRVNTCCNSLLFITKSKQLKLTSNYIF